MPAFDPKRDTPQLSGKFIESFEREHQGLVPLRALNVRCCGKRRAIFGQWSDKK